MQTFFDILAFGYLFFAVATASSSRFWVTRRNYIWVSSILAVILFLTGYTLSSSNMMILGSITFVCKSIVIPLFMRSLNSTHDTAPKLSSRLRPTLTRFLSLVIIMFVGGGIMLLPNAHFLNENLPMTIVAFSSIGIAMLALGAAKSTYGQLFGVLMIENAFSLLILTLGLEFHLFIELGLLVTALFAWLIMHILSNRIRHVFGTEAIAQLNELSE